MHISTYSKILLFLLVLAPLGTDAAFAIGFHTGWHYKQSGGEGVETRSEFQQAYGLRFSEGPDLEYKPTSAISIGASVNYTRTDRSSDIQGEVTSRETLTPIARMSLVNDIFRIQISGASSIKSDDGAGFVHEGQSWDSTLASSWDIPYWPRLSFNSGKTFTPLNDVTRKTHGMTLQQDLHLADFYYSYSNSQTDNPNNRSLSESTSHFALLETRGTFLNGRGNFNFSQQVQQSDQDITVGDTLDLGGEKSFWLFDPDVTVDDEGNPIINDPEDIDYSGTDNAGGFAAGLRAPPGNEVHISLNLNFSEKQIDLLRITFDPRDVTALSTADIENLQWALYVRNEFDTAWELVSNAVTSTYVPVEDRLDLEIGLTEKKILLRTTLPSTGADSLTFNTIEALQDSQSAGSTFISSRSKLYFTDFNVSFRFSRSLQVSTTMTRDASKSEDDDSVSKNSDRVLSGNLRWTPTPFISSSISMTENLITEDGQPDKVTRNYRLNVPTAPLEKLKVSFSVNHFESFIGDLKTSVGQRYSVYTKALIYPDLTSSLSLYKTDTSTLDSNGLFVDQTSIYSNLKLSAQLLRKLVSDVQISYNRSMSGAERISNSAGKVTLQYRASELLIFTGRYETVFSGPSSTRPDKFNLGMKVFLLHTDKARLDLTSSHSREGSEKVDAFALRGSWDISRNFALTFNGTYAMAETNGYIFRTSLIGKF